MIDAYCAPPGNGKGYLLCEAAIALRKSGRDVFLNLAGVRDRLELWDALEPDAGKRLGRLVVVDREWLLDPANYPTFDCDTFSDVRETGFLPGAVLVVEEAHLYFGNPKDVCKDSGERPVAQRVLKFFRQHRHFVRRFDDGSVQEADVLLDTQDLMSLHPQIRRQIRRTYVPESLVDAGLKRRIMLRKYPGARNTGKSDNYFMSKDMRVHDYYESVKGGAPAGVHKVDTQKRGGAWRWWHLIFPLVAVGAMAALAFVAPRAWAVFDRSAPTSSPSPSAPLPVAAAPVGSKPACDGSGIVLDTSDRTAFDGSVWRPVVVETGPDGSQTWDVGSCVFYFSGP